MVVYVAGRYRGNIAENIAAARDVAVAVWNAGHYALCPHLNTAHFEIHAPNVPDSVWLAGTLELMRRCDSVVLVPGWEQSSGTVAEVAEAKRLGMPVFVYPELPHD